MHAILKTRRSILRAAASLPSLALFGQDTDAWKRRRRLYLETASKVKDQPLWQLHAETNRLPPGVAIVGVDFTAAHRAIDTVYAQLSRLAIGESIEPSAFDSVLEYLASRQDLVDFIMAGILRILCLYGNDSRLPQDLKRRMEAAVFEFRPWLYAGDPAVKTVAVYWTENHEALYSSIEYLSGELYPNKTFRWLGKPGSWHREHGRRNMLVWLGLRARYGMSEWLSPGYYSEDIIALMNLVDFAKDPPIAKGSKGVMDIIMLDLALHSFDGGLRATSGRSYLTMLKDARTADTSGVVSLGFGIDSPVLPPISGSAISVATSPSYRVPEAIVRIAHARPPELLVHEKSGFSPEEALKMGFRPDDPEDILTYWTIAAYTHPSIFLGSEDAFHRWNITHVSAESKDGKEATYLRTGGDPAKYADNGSSALFGADIETYRTPDYQVSTAQDYRKGKPAFQQQIFLASLGGAASVWTSHPGADTEQGRPSYWIGNGRMPRAAQHKNLVFVLYRIPEGDPRPFSHAYFPVSQFEEVQEKEGWIFGRKGNGYIGLTARPQMTPTRRAEYQGVERISNSLESTWICRLGRKAQDGTFATFVERLAKTEIDASKSRVSFSEPNGMKASFGWDEDLVVDGNAVPLRGYPRYDSPYIKVARSEQLYRVACDGRTYTIDLTTLKVGPLREIR